MKTFLSFLALVGGVTAINFLPILPYKLALHYSGPPVPSQHVTLVGEAKPGTSAKLKLRDGREVHIIIGSIKK